MKYARMIVALGLVPLAALVTVSAHADTGPSLAATMDFIVEKISVQQGKMGWAIFGTKVDGTTINNSAQRVTDKIKYDPKDSCAISLHIMDVINDRVGSKSYKLKFPNITDIRVEPLEKFYYRLDNVTTAPDQEIYVSPQVYILTIVGTRSTIIGKTEEYNDFYFYDESMADRVAKAFAHAVQLCGGFKPKSK